MIGQGNDNALSLLQPAVRFLTKPHLRLHVYVGNPTIWTVETFLFRGGPHHYTTMPRESSAASLSAAWQFLPAEVRRAAGYPLTSRI